ncbi:MAG: phosphoglycolate phosphatase [Geobacter sp.]|nr:phosphoglycolate phosphatase [Geobacter sp.]
MANGTLIIFDLDGTLIDSLDDLTEAVNHMLSAFDRPHLVRKQVQTLVGQGARRLVEQALPGAEVHDIRKGLDLFLAYNAAHIADQTTPYPGVAETLALLKERGVAMTLVSNKDASLCRTLLEVLGLAGHFEAVYGADSFQARKPSPEPLLHVMRQFKRDAADTVMVGDSINDIAAGKAAGVRTIACTYGYGELDALQGADWHIDSFRELLTLPIRW